MARRLPLPLAAIALLFALAAVRAAAETPSILLPSPLVFTFNFHFAPKKLPPDRRAGASLRIDDKIAKTDGGLPPALREFVLEIDRSAAFDAKGLPACRPFLLKQDDTAGAELDCGPSMVGDGKTEFDVAFPEQAPFPVPSKVIAFNGGVSGGRTKIWIFAYLPAPVSAAMVMPVEVSPVQKGRYGIQAVATVPKIAGGYGSITSFSLQLGREFSYRGQPHSYFSLKCADGRISAHDTARFADGTEVTASVVRPCIKKG